MDKVRQVTSTLQMLLTSLEPSRERAMVLRWKEEAERYAERREQRLKILAAIGDGYDTYAEIIAETGIPRSTVMKVMNRLMRDNSVTKTLVNKPNKRSELQFEVSIKN